MVVVVEKKLSISQQKRAAKIVFARSSEFQDSKTRGQKDRTTRVQTVVISDCSSPYSLVLAGGVVRLTPKTSSTTYGRLSSQQTSTSIP